MIEELVGKPNTHRTSWMLKVGTISLWHFDKQMRTTCFDRPDKAHDILNCWMHEIKPAVKRGDKVEVRIKFS